MLPYNIHCNYPGGNIKVNSVEHEKVKIEQDIRDSTRWWFYWNFCIENAQGHEITFEFTNGEVIGPWGPARSHDGIDWTWMESAGLYDRTSFKYRFDEKETKVFFSFSLPYQAHDFERFYNKHSKNKLLARNSLTTTKCGREVPLLVIGNPEAKQHILLTARHHACESTASYLLEGLISQLLEISDSSLYNNYLVHVIPFVDIDGVENGDQGKARSPHDYNQDYIDNPLYESTKAIMEYAKLIKPVAGIDFHSPWKWGGRSNNPFFVKKYSPIKEEIEKLGSILEELTCKNETAGKIVYNTSNDMEMGVGWNQPNHISYTAFLADMGAKLSCTIEFPYFGTGNIAYTQENCREFGKDFARALKLYLNILL